MARPIPTIYIHFLDRYHPRRAQKNGNSNAVIKREATLAFRLALLVSSRVVVPSSSLYEGSLCWQLIKQHPDFVAGGYIEATSNDGDLKEHLERKQASYDSLSPEDLKAAYREHRSGLMPRFSQKQTSTAPALIDNWMKYPDQNDFLNELATGDQRTFGMLWREMPDLLKSRAFIPEHVQNVFQQKGITLRRSSFLNGLIEPPYIRAYTSELSAGIIEDLVSLNNPFRFSSNHQNISYTKFYRELDGLSLLPLITGASSELLWFTSIQFEWDVVSSGIVHGDMSDDVREAAAVLLKKSLLVGRSLAGRAFFTVPESLDFDKSIPNRVSPPAAVEKGDESTMSKTKTAALLCAVETEFQAIVKLFPPLDDSRIIDGSYSTSSAGWNIVVKRFSGMGELDAAIDTSTIISRHNPDVCILVGIAGGFKKEGRHLGDVIVADQIIGYELAKLEGSKVSLRPQAFRSSANLIAIADTVARENKWQEHITSARPHSSSESSKVIIGSILSGNKVVAAEGFLEEFRSQWTTIVGIEMEAAGMALAVHRNAAQPQFLMVKSICDFADESKNDEWQRYAAEAAASFAVELINLLGKSVSPADVTPVVSVSPLTPIEKNEIRRRFGNDWEEVADLFDIPNTERIKWKAGREPHSLWQWLVDRERLDELASVLLHARRKDILDDMPNLAERLSISS